jgi:hypothetical protein
VLLNTPLSWLIAKTDRALDRGGLMPVTVLATARKPSS